MTIWTGSSGIVRLLWKLGVGLALATALPGCLAHASGEIVYDHPVAYVEDVPPRIEHYPRTSYHGQPAYLVDGSWYYRHQDRWVVFSEEPVELRDYRVRSAPVYASGSRRYSDVAADRRQHAEQRRQAEQRRYAEQRAAERRAEARRATERHERERVAAERRERHERDRIAAERRERDRIAAERRAQRRERVAERLRPSERRRERNRQDRNHRDDRDDRDDHDDRRRERD